MEFDKTAKQIRKNFPLIIKVWRKLYKMMHWSIGDYGRWVWIKDEMSQINRDGFIILDAGCGQGMNSIRLQKLGKSNTIIGIDIDDQVVHFADNIRKNLKVQNVNFVVASLDDIPVRQGSVDITLMTEVLTVVDDDQTTVYSISRAMKTGGFFVIHVPSSDHRNFIGYLSPKNFPGRKRYGYTEESLTELLTKNGFTINKIRHTFGRFAGTMWELWYICGYSPFLWPLRFLLRPFYLISMRLDRKSNCNRGRGLLCVAQRT